MILTTGTTLLLLLLLSVSYTAAATRLERLRLAVSHRRVASMLGVFTFAAVVVLPLPLLAGFVPLVYLAAWPTFSRAGMKAHRWAYSAAAATVACLVSSGVLHTIPGMLAYPAAIAAFMLTNLALVAVPIVAEGSLASLAMLANPRVHATVLGTQLLGAAVGLGMQWHQPVGLAGLPLLLALHKRTTRREVVETEAFTDGIWSQDAWTALAEEAHRAGRWFSVIVIDLADPATAAVTASVLVGYLRAGDSLGRLGRGQLALLLDKTTANAAQALAALITADLRAVAVAAGVGSADSKHATVSQMLVLASGDAILQGASASPAVETL